MRVLLEQEVEWDLLALALTFAAAPALAHFLARAGANAGVSKCLILVLVRVLVVRFLGNSASPHPRVALQPLGKTYHRFD
jgi:hypothetical protein